MRLNVRRIHCNSCLKLVWGQVERANAATRVSCPKCGRLLWVWAGLNWRYGGAGSTGSKP